jgi:hypothetical protein
LPRNYGKALASDNGNCIPCEDGMVAGAGAAKCDRCPIGTYMDWQAAADSITDAQAIENLYVGADATKVQAYKDKTVREATSGCTKCPLQGTSTLHPASESESDCGCRAGSYLSVKEGRCKDCPEGMECPLGSRSDNIGKVLLVRRGFFLDSAEEPLHVYQCGVMGDATEAQGNWEPRCVGPGIRACLPGSGGLNCAVCDDNHYPNAAGHCQKCNAGDGAMIFIVFAIMTIIPPSFYYLLNGKNTAMMAMSLAMAVAKFNFITTMALENLPFDWSEEFRLILITVRVLAMDFNSVTSQCMLGNTALYQWLFIIAIPMWLVVILFAFSKFTRAYLAEDSKWRMEYAETFNVFGTVYQAIFITVVIGILQPFRCYPHPNGSDLMSVVNFPNVICGSDEHLVMVGFAVLALLFTCLNFFLYVAYKAYYLPSMSHDEHVDPVWRRKLKFMIYRFRHGAWYWGVPFLLRSILIGFCNVVAPGWTFTQMNLLMLVLMLYLVIQCAVWPWKNAVLNIVDMVLGATMIMMVAAALPFTGKPEQHVTDQAAMCIIIWFVGASLSMVLHFGSMLLLEVRKWLNPKLRQEIVRVETEMYSATAQDLVHICSKVSACWETEDDQKELGRFMKILGPYDVQLLHKVIFMLNLELFASESSQKLQLAEGHKAGSSVLRVRSF